MSSMSSRSRRLLCEELESRQLLAGAAPTAVEQLFLELLNDARQNPAAYGAAIGVDLTDVAPSQPLAFNPLLIQAARDHAADMSNRGYFAHTSPPPDNLGPGDRIAAAGFGWTGYGESLAGGTAFPGPAETLRALIIDEGIPDLGHRRHLLAIDALFKNQNQVGIGIVQNTAGPLTNYYTIDSAAGFDQRPLITGVVFRDANGNGKYDVGEGLGGVTITVAGVGTVTTFDSGGYSFQLNPGTYTVTASGGALLGPQTQTVTLGSTNARLNVIASMYDPRNDDLIRKLYVSALGRAASDAEVRLWQPVAGGSNGHAVVADAIERSTEGRTRLVKGWYTTYLGRSAANGEEQGWVRALVSGVTEEQILSGILGSQEYFQRAGGRNDTLVQTLFQQFLGRAAGQNEVSLFVNMILPALNRVGMVNVVVASQEYRGRMVTSYYTALLHRTPPASEVNGWVQSGLDLARVRIGFKGSNEYFLNG